MILEQEKRFMIIFIDFDVRFQDLDRFFTYCDFGVFGHLDHFDRGFDTQTVFIDGFRIKPDGNRREIMFSIIFTQMGLLSWLDVWRIWTLLMIKPSIALRSGCYCRPSAECNMKMSKARCRSLKTILILLGIPMVVMKII